MQFEVYDQQSACKHTSHNWKRVRKEVSVSYHVRPRFIIKAIIILLLYSWRWSLYEHVLKSYFRFQQHGHSLESRACLASYAVIVCFRHAWRPPSIKASVWEAEVFYLIDREWSLNLPHTCHIKSTETRAGNSLLINALKIKILSSLLLFV